MVYSTPFQLSLMLIAWTRCDGMELQDLPCKAAASQGRHRNKEA